MPSLDDPLVLLKSAARRALYPGSIPVQARLQHSPIVLRTWRRVIDRNLTYMTPAQLSSLLGLCAEMERHKEAGIIVEAGCAHGGSAILLCAAKSRHRPLHVYDVFGELPPPSDRDGSDLRARYETIAAGRAEGLGGRRYYAYEENLKDQVRRTFVELDHPVEEHTVQLIEGKVQDTLHLDAPVCLAHVDVDWYEPVMTCLERIVPRLTPRGAVVLHAYRDWSGCRSATDDYFERVGRERFVFNDSAGHLVVRRHPGAEA